MRTTICAWRTGDLERIGAGRVPNVPVSATSPSGDARDVDSFLHKGAEIA